MFLKNLLFPKFCLGCGYLGAYICPKCQNQLIYIEKDSCLYCGRLSYRGLTHPGCQREKGADGLISVFFYNNLLKKIIKTIKYRFAVEVWRELCLTIKPKGLQKIFFYKKLISACFLQPVPLHPKKLKERGFNQSQIIAEYFNQFIQAPLVNHLKRKKETLSQAQINERKERYLNMRGAFEVDDKEAVKNKNYVLVDDVVTSGSTVNEATRVLKQAGAKKVFVLTVGRG